MRRAYLRAAFLPLAAAVATLCSLLAVQTADAEHGHAVSLRIVSVSEDQFINWDFKNKGTAADWPINILFWNNAEVDKIKTRYRWDGWFGSECGDTMWGALSDGGGWMWDSDDGVKTPCTPACFVAATHMRLYAPPATDRLYNLAWGYYVIASTHKDRNEACPFGTKHGWSEDAEQDAVNTAKGFGWRAGHDWADFFNPLASVYLGNHYLQNDGRASHVQVP